MTEVKNDSVTLAEIRSKFKIYPTTDLDLFTGSQAISFNLQYFFSKYWERLGIDRSATLNSSDRTIIEDHP